MRQKSEKNGQLLSKSGQIYVVKYDYFSSLEFANAIELATYLDHFGVRKPKNGRRTWSHSELESCRALSTIQRFI